MRLKCVSDGVPTPTLSWYKPEGTKFNPVKANENTVDVTMNSDQDFGLYNCTADNGFDPASLTVRVQQISEWRVIMLFVSLSLRVSSLGSANALKI